MEHKTTDKLDDILKNTKPDHLSGYLKDNRRYLAGGGKAFYYYMKDVLEDKNMKLKDVYSFAGYSESYGSKILTMEKHVKDRDAIIRLCVAGHFLVDEINRALKLYGFSELYAKNPRDACLIVAVHNRIYDFCKIDDLLKAQGQKKLSHSE